MFHSNSCLPAVFSPAQESGKQQSPSGRQAGTGTVAGPEVCLYSRSRFLFPWYINYFGSFPAVSGDKWWQWEPIFNLHCSGCMLCSCRLLSAQLSGKGFRHLPAAPSVRLLPCTWKAQPLVPASFRAQPPCSAFMDAPQAGGCSPPGVPRGSPSNAVASFGSKLFA